MRRAALAAVSLVAAAAMAAPAFGSAPQLAVSSASGALGKATSVTLDYALTDAASDAAAGFTVYAPPGYQARLDQAPGAAVGRVLSASVVAGGIPAQADDGTVVAADETASGAVFASCPAGPHAAAWLAELATPAGSLQLPLVVDPVGGSAASAFASLRVQACPAPDLGLLGLTLQLDSVFTNPAAPGTYVWRGLAAPGSAAAASVESRSVVPLPVELSLRGSYDRGKRAAVLSGVLQADGAPVGGQTISLFAGSGPGSTKPSGTAKTDAQGHFRVRRSIDGATYFRASASVPAQDVTATGCADPIAPGGCVSATRGPLLAGSAVVRVTVPPPPVLHLGSRGAAVKSLQRQLARLHYLPPGSRGGVFDERTWHAVVAFQGWRYLGRTGVVNRRTWNALQGASPPKPFGGMTRGVEIDISRQVLLLVSGGRTVRALHVSTAAPGHYTPRGHFHVYRKETLSWSVPFQVWMPYANYFYGGFAVHGLASVPAYPASHGCVRLPLVEAPIVYAFTTIGMPVWIR